MRPRYCYYDGIWRKIDGIIMRINDIVDEEYGWKYMMYIVGGEDG